MSDQFKNPLPKKIFPSPDNKQILPFNNKNPAKEKLQKLFKDNKPEIKNGKTSINNIDSRQNKTLNNLSNGEDKGKYEMAIAKTLSKINELEESCQSSPRLKQSHQLDNFPLPEFQQTFAKSEWNLTQPDPTEKELEVNKRRPSINLEQPATSINAIPTNQNYYSGQMNKTTNQSSMLSLNSKFQSTQKQSKIRLRDYLFMINTSVDAASKKKAQQIKQNRTITNEPSARTLLSQCRSDTSLTINSRYHSQKYQINSKEIGQVLKKQLKVEISTLKARISELEELVDFACQGIDKSDLTMMLQLKRNLKSSGQKIEQTITKIKTPQIPELPQQEPTQLAKKESNHDDLLSRLPLIGTIHNMKP